MDTCMVAIMPPTDRDDVVAEVGRLMGVNFERDEQGKLLVGLSRGAIRN